jgi:PAS domain S-box-containing protein
MLVNTLRLRGPAAPARLAAVLTILVAVIALAGWMLDLRLLVSIVPAAVEMKVNTGIALICSGLALLILCDGASLRLEQCAQILAFGVALLGLGTLCEYVFGWNPHIDELILKDASPRYTVFHGRMSPLSAFAFTALGLALGIMRYRALRRLAAAGAWFAAAIAATSLLGYLWYAGELTTDRWLPPVALNTACGFLLLGIGMLLSPRVSEAGWAQELTALPSVEKKTLLGFFAGFCLLLVGGGVTYRANVEFATSSSRVARSQEVRATLAAVRASLAGADLAERDYLLTGDPARLEEYRTLKDEVETSLTRLAGLTSDNPVQRKNLAGLESLVSAHLEDLAGSLNAFAQSGLVAARAVLAQGRSLGITGQIRLKADVMDGLERGYLTARQAEAARIRDTTLVSLLVTLAVAAVVFIALFGAIHGEMRGRRHSESELLEANRFLDSLIENLPVMIVLKDAKTLRFVRQNRAFEQFTGIGREQLTGKSAHELFTADEADFMVAKDREVLATGAVVEIPEQTIRTPHLGERCFHTMKMPVPGQDGRAQYLLAISIDITQRKLSAQAVHELNAALQGKASQLETTNKELESFSYSVSHDLRAPLRGIDGFAQMLEEDYFEKLDAEGRRYLAVIRQASRRMGELIDDLLALSRLGRQPVITRGIDMDDLVREVVEEILGLHGGVPPEVVVGELPPAEGDAGLLRQVWTNLVSNAVKYSSKATQPRIHIEGTRGGGELRYSVRDNGVGFNMEYAGKLFGVFQRLHRHDEFSGTGVGLAIVQRIILKHGGRVWAEAALGEGAEFSFALPAVVHAAGGGGERGVGS